MRARATAATVAALLILLAAPLAGALQLQIMVGTWFLVCPGIEISVLTAPHHTRGFEQECGLRFTYMAMDAVFDLVLRSWLTFPESRSDFSRDRFRCGLEYSPVLFSTLYSYAWFPLGFRPGLWAALRVNNPSADTTMDFFCAMLGYVERYTVYEFERPEGSKSLTRIATGRETGFLLMPAVGFGLRSPDL